MRWKVNEIDTERAGSILRIQLNRPEKRNAMTSNMYVSIAQLLNDPTGGGVAITSLIENRTDKSERRTWFLAEISAAQ
jgi:1,4-dihydroxy-2-naphthoyl-CoA synthase